MELLFNHEDFFDEMLRQYCITHYHKKIITDANYNIINLNANVIIK